MNAANDTGARTAKVFSSLAPGYPRFVGASSLIPLLLLLAASGCASIPFFGKTAKFEQADAKNPAVEILTLWQCTEGPGPQGVPIRGFAGQIYFFTQNKGAPVLVNGKVRIYVFDDHGTAQEQGRPIGEYDFNSANWNARAQRSSLGPGYSVFIPYPRNDFHQATCSLRVRFVPAVGPTIYSARRLSSSTARRTSRCAATSRSFRRRPFRQPRQRRPHPAVGDVGTVVPADLVAAVLAATVLVATVFVAAGHRSRRRHRGRHAVFAGQCG